MPIVSWLRAAVIPVAVLVPSQTFAQAGLTRSETGAVTGAIQSQIREAVRPRLMISNSAGAITGLALGGDGALLAIAPSDHSVRVWDLQNGLQQAQLTPPGDVNAIRISADSRSLVLGTRSGGVAAMRTAMGAPAVTVQAGVGPVAAVAISRDGAVIAAAGNDGVVRVWDGRTGGPLAVVPGAFPISALALAADGRTVVAGTSDGRLVSGSGAAASPPVVVRTPSPAILGVTVAGPGRAVAVGSDGAVYAWDGRSPAPARTLAPFGVIRAVGFSGDGQLAAVSDAQDHLKTIDLRDGRVLQDIAAAPASAHFIAVDLNHRRLLTGGNDGLVRLRNLDTGGLLVQIISTLSGWTALDAQGRFDGTSAGVDNLKWLASELKLPIDNFSQPYFEPGLVARYMRDQAGFVAPAPTPVIGGFALPPRVAISSEPVTLDAGASVAVTVVAQDQGGGIGAVSLFQNGKLVPPERRTGERREAQGVASVIQTYRLPLAAGINRLEAVATSLQQIEGEHAVAEVTAGAGPVLPTVHILAIGINKYRDPRFDLDYGVSDASSILQSLSQSSAAAFARVDAQRLTDAGATRAAIVGALTNLQRAPAEDVLVVYVAGHGEIVGDEWYLLPHDVVFTPEGIRRTGIGATAFRDLLSRVGPQRVLFMIDSCKSGGSVDTLATAIDRKMLRSLGRDAGVAILAAARRDQSAEEFPQLGHGAFTYVVLDGLNGKADVRRDGRITSGELLTYSTSELPSLTKRLINQMQVPVAYNRGEDFLVRQAGK